MEKEQNFFALALIQADEKIAAIDRQCESLKLQLDALVSQKTVLIATRRALLIQEGDLSPNQIPLPQSSAPTKSFKGMSLAAAARKYIFDIGAPQTHAEVVGALLKENVRIASKHPGNSIRTSMQKHPDWFRWVKPNGDRGHWELVEWPSTIQQPREPSSETAAAGPNLSLVPQKSV
jgi:hypothetical protein